MIDWWWCAIVAGLIAPVAYAFGKATEKERCVGIAIDKMGSVRNKVEYSVAESIAERISAPNGSNE